MPKFIEEDIKYHNWFLSKYAGRLPKQVEWYCKNCSEIRISDDEGYTYLPPNERCSRVHVNTSNDSWSTLHASDNISLDVIEDTNGSIRNVFNDWRNAILNSNTED